MKKVAIVIKHGSTDVMPKEIKDMMESAYGKEVVSEDDKELDKDPEDKEVEDTKNPKIK